MPDPPPLNTPRLGDDGDTCSACGAALAADQRYCLACGESRTRPRVNWRGVLAASAAAGTAGAAAAAGPAAAGALVEEEDEGDPGEGEAAAFPLPSPRVALALIVCVLAFGVVLGGAAGPRVPNSDAAGRPVILVSVPAAQQAPAQTPPADTTPAITPPPPVVAPAPVPITPAPVTPAPAPAPPPDTPTGGTTPVLAPTIKHVWLVMLGGQGFDAMYGPSSTATYLSKDLAAKGETLSQYYAIAHESLPNGIAVLSGQGPTKATQQNCPTYDDLTPGTVADDRTAQAKGDGCVYPGQNANMYTLMDQLPAQGLTWKAYIGGQGPTPAATTRDTTTTTTTPTTTTPAPPAATPTCRHPQTGQADPWHEPTATDPYVTWRNPFVYFHTITDADTCATTVVGLDQLPKDLAKAKDTPSFSYLAPDVCHDGSSTAQTPCGDGAPVGPAAADAWLKATIPAILASPAYKDSGAIIITTDNAPSSGPGADSSTCCGTPKAYPNTDDPGLAPTPSPGGGGRVGALILSPLVKPGTTVAAPRNHFSLLKGIQDIFGLKYLGYTNDPKVKGFGKEIWTKWDGKA